MALSYYIEVSPGTPGSPPSVENGSFLPLGDPIPDLGVPIDFYHIQASTPGIIPGVLYAYRARRFDSETGLFSPYSPVVFARALIPYTEATMDGILDSVITGAKVEVGIGLEDYEGYAVKATKKLEVNSVSFKRAFQTLYAMTLRNAPTMRSKAVVGMAKLDGPLSVLVTPEGGFLLLLATFLKHTISGAGPYTHKFSNLFGAKSGTLVVRIGQFLFVLAGTRVQSMGFENLNAEPNAVVTANVNIVALTVVAYDLNVDPGAYARCGMDTAGTDPLPAYSGVHMLSAIGGTLGTVRSANHSVTKQLEGKKTANGKRGYSAYYETKTEVAVQASTYFEDMENILRDFGQPADSVLPVGGSMNIINAPFSLIFSPPNNGAGFSNLLTFQVPNAITETDEDAKDDKAVEQNITFQSLDVPGDAAGTDYWLTIVNSVTDAGLMTPSTPIPNFPATALTTYFSAGVKAAPAPTTTVFSGDLNNLPSFSAVDNDPVYLAKSVVFLTGALKGQKRRITGYTAPTGGAGPVFTVGTAFASAPMTADQFTIA